MNEIEQKFEKIKNWLLNKEEAASEESDSVSRKESDSVSREEFDQLVEVVNALLEKSNNEEGFFIRFNF
jgi:hypothetical protein